MPKIANRRLTLDPDRIPREFWHYFRSPQLRASPKLWRSFIIWRDAHAMDAYAAFAKELGNMRETAMAEMAAFGNPFPNTVKGQPYEVSFELPECVKKYHISGLREWGLECASPENARQCVIKGLPEQSGQATPVLTWIWAGWRQGAALLQNRFPFYINPDPSELWKIIPSDPFGEYASPDMESETLVCANAQLFSASRRGRSHAHQGSFRDDAVAIACVDQWQILLVADGAGSAKFSRKGAELACSTAISTCREILPANQELTELLNAPNCQHNQEWEAKARKLAYGILPQAAFNAHKAIRQEAEKTGRKAGDYATTFLMLLARRTEAGWAVFSFQIGDGAICLINPSGATLLQEPDEGEYGGQTRFLTMSSLFDAHELMRRLKFTLSPDLTSALLLTDGISDPRFPSSEELHSSSAWLNLWGELRPLLASPDPGDALLDWLAFWSKGNHDDRSIALLTVENDGFRETD